MICATIDCNEEVSESKCEECLALDLRLATLREKTKELIIEDDDLIEDSSHG